MTAAKMPTKVTGHDTPLLYGPRMTNISRASKPAKRRPSAAVMSVEVQTRHLLCSISVYQPPFSRTNVKEVTQNVITIQISDIVPN